MKYMLLIHHDYQAVSVTPGAWMEPPELATTVRVAGGKPLTTDGRFVAVKEALGGSLFYEADDLGAAIELASRIPAARLGGAVEARAAYERALELVHSDAERRFLEQRLAEFA